MEQPSDVDDDNDLLAALQAGRVTALRIDQDTAIDDWTALAKAARGCAVDTVAVSHVKLTGGPAQDALVEVLQQPHHPIRAVALEGCHLTAAHTRALAQAVPWASPHLQSLSLAHNPTLGPRGIKVWCEYLSPKHKQKTATLHHLDCQDCAMGHFGAQALGQVLPTSLLSLHLAHNQLGADGMWKMAHRLADLTALQTLDLSYNQMGDDGCLELARTLASSSSSKSSSSSGGAGHAHLHTLRLAGNALGDAGLTELAKLLSQQALPALAILDVSHNQVGNGSAVSLGSALASCGALQVLHLSHNRVGDPGCAALVEGLLPPAIDDSDDDEDSDDDDDESHDASAQAYLAENDPGELPPFPTQDTRPPRHESRLRELFLDHNQIGDEGAGSLVEHLDKIEALHTVSLEGNPISDARRRILDLLLKHRTTLASPKKTTTTTFDPNTSFSMSERDEETNHSETLVASLEASLDHGTTIDPTEIAQGRDRLFAVSSQDEEDAVPKLPMGYLTHVTDHWQRIVVPHGTFGPLFRAIDQEATVEGEEDSLFLVRRLELSPAGRMEAVRTAVLAELPKLRHRHIAPLVATSTIQGTYAFMYEIPDPLAMPLSKCLSEVEYRKSLSWSVRLRLAACIADTVEFLHKDTGRRKAALHGDLHPESIYVSSDFERIFLLDAGMSRLLATDRSKFSHGDVVYGSRGYRCPRYERGSIAYDTSCDIFALGILIAELATCRMQRSRETKSEIGYDVYYDCYLARKPIRTDPLAGPITKALMQNLGRLILACLNPLPSQRPTATTVSHLLHECVKLA